MRSLKSSRVAMAVAVALAASAASAAPVANWTYEVTSAFDTAPAATTFVNSGTNPGPVNPSTGYWTSTKMSLQGLASASRSPTTATSTASSSSPTRRSPS